MKPLFLKWHLGLGDSVLCNGMVRVFARQFSEVMIPAKPHNLQTVKWMFSDLPNVTVVEVKDDQDMQLRSRAERQFDSFGIGLFSNRGLQPQNWDRAFYEDCQLDFECRWSEFKLPLSDSPKSIAVFPAFVHQDSKRGYVIDQSRLPTCSGVYMPNPGDPMSKHVPLLAHAAEIHVIDSCFLCLADSIETSATRHVLHAYATRHDPYKKFGPPTLRKNWEILR